MEHHFNHKAESFDSPKNIFIANLIRQEVEKQVHFRFWQWYRIGEPAIGNSIQVSHAC